MQTEQSEVFLSDYDMFLLTGYKNKARQVQQLRKMGIAFFVNACGHPRVPKAVIEGQKDRQPQEKKWVPSWEPNLDALRKKVVK